MTVSVMITTKGRLVDLRGDFACLAAIESSAIGGADHARRLPEDIAETIKVELAGARVFVNKIRSVRLLHVIG